MQPHCTGTLVGGFVALVAAASFAQQPDVVRPIVAENTALSAQIANDTTALDRALVELADLRKAKRDLEERMQRIEHRAAVYALGQEFAQALTEQLRQLPRPERFAVADEQRAEQLAAASDADLRVERALSELDDLDAATAKRLAAALPPLSQEQRSQVEATMRAALVEQRDLLQRLTAIESKRLEALREAGEAARDLQRQGEAARTKLTRFLFWIPAPPSTKTVGGLVPALAWTISPTNWRSAGRVIWGGTDAQALLVCVGAPYGDDLSSHCAPNCSGRSCRFRPPPLPTGAIGSATPSQRLRSRSRSRCPPPMVLWSAATLLATAPDSQPFALALGAALLATSRLLIAILTLAWLLDRRGVAVRHFGWDEASLSSAARALRRFAAVFVPLAFVAALNGLDHAPFANRESLARLAFSLAMITLVAFLVRLLRAGSLMIQRLRARAPGSWPVQLHALWFAALLVVPVAVATLAAAGYFVAAGYFWARILESVFLAIGAVILYGLMALWVQVQRLHLGRRRDEEAARPKETATALEAGSEVAEARPKKLDIAMIGEQTRSLLDMGVTLLLLGGVWWLWKDALPVLSVISDHSLWSYAEVVNSKQVTHQLTIGHLVLAIVVGVVTAVVVRNVGALLDIVLLRRLELQTDATYAIKVIARYAVTLVGVVVACNILGLRWSDVQWLVAALGVGLGFGLQEIVANFVSGLIVLAERPIRIGDVVTVGGVSGTVARIHARATAVIDFDNKEVIIPNKAFITERVVNWTLTNETTRLLIKVGVAYGSDVALVQRVVLDAVRANRDVLQDPAPSAFFVAFGDSTLDFEIRAFVDSIDKRLRVQHEINIELARVLRENGIEIPFPQRDLHIRSAPGLADTLRNDQRG